MAAFYQKNLLHFHRLNEGRRHYMSENTTFTQEKGNFNKIVSERVKLSLK